MWLRLASRFEGSCWLSVDDVIAAALVFVRQLLWHVVSFCCKCVGILTLNVYVVG